MAVAVAAATPGLRFVSLKRHKQQTAGHTAGRARLTVGISERRLAAVQSAIGILRIYSSIWQVWSCGPYPMSTRISIHTIQQRCQHCHTAVTWILSRKAATLVTVDSLRLVILEERKIGTYTHAC